MLWQLGFTTSRLTSHGELMVHAGCEALQIWPCLPFYSVCRKDTYICENFDGKCQTIPELKGHEVNMICKENCLFSLRTLVKGNPTRVDFAPKNMCQQTRQSLVKPLSKPMVAFCWLEPKKQISMEFESKYIDFQSIKSIEKFRLQNGPPFVSASMC